MNAIEKLVELEGVLDEVLFARGEIKVGSKDKLRQHGITVAKSEGWIPDGMKAKPKGLKAIDWFDSNEGGHYATSQAKKKVLGRYIKGAAKRGTF